MKKCRQCGTLLDEHEDTCTVCGIDHPFEKEKKKTEYDLTVMFNAMGSDVNLYRVKKRKTFLLLAWLLGFLGAPLFYTGYLKKGLISILLFLLISGISFLLLFLGKIFNLPLCLLISFGGTIVLLDIISGIIFSKNTSFKDCNGEYLR